MGQITLLRALRVPLGQLGWGSLLKGKLWNVVTLPLVIVNTECQLYWIEGYKVLMLVVSVWVLPMEINI